MADKPKTKFSFVVFIAFFGGALVADLISFGVPFVGTAYIVFCRAMFFLMGIGDMPGVKGAKSLKGAKAGGGAKQPGSMLKVLMNVMTAVGGVIEVIPGIEAIPSPSIFVLVTYLLVKSSEYGQKATKLAGTFGGSLGVGASAAVQAIGGGGMTSAKPGSLQGAGGVVGAVASGLTAKAPETEGAKKKESGALPKGKSTDQFGMPGPLAGSKQGESPYAQPEEQRRS